MNYPKTPGMELPFERCANFRELGGYRGQNGRRVRHGVFFRGPALTNLSTARDRALYRRLNIKTVFDLRPSSVRRACPDPLLDGVERIVGASGGTGVFGAAQEAAPKDAGDAMAYREILRAAARGQTPLLIHGVSGRGATGIASMLLLKMLGVSDEDAIGDYLLSNRYCAGAKLERENAENFLARVRARYGTFENYLERACGVGPQALAHVRERYLEAPQG
ncbi:MAG TPA: tyrosine-protein phosphatase [Candidatus Ruthenibacterium merdigallinarum]|nr:tyrosine-protein phosphatase [Candidatus Ruthenibacterium merdigallinarum]